MITDIIKIESRIFKNQLLTNKIINKYLSFKKYIKINNNRSKKIFNQNLLKYYN